MNEEFNQFDKIEGDEETEEFDVIVLEDEENGESIELVVIETVELEDFNYLLVVPVEEMEEETPSASIIKEYKDEDEEFVYEPVEDEKEFEDAAKYFSDEK